MGFYVPDTGQWFLKNGHEPGVAETSFTYGLGGAGWRPLVGRWQTTTGSSPAALLSMANAPAASAVDRVHLALLAAQPIQPSVEEEGFDDLFGIPGSGRRRSGNHR